jgi:hypothetical protein
MSWRFTQSDNALAAAGDGECHLLESLEGPPPFARLAQDGAALSDALDYRMELLTDTGPASEAYGALMLVAFNVPPQRSAEVADWYDREHIRLLMRADGWLRARRFGVSDQLCSLGGKRWTSLAFHELRDVSVLDSAERKFARSTAWRAELEKEAWFLEAGRFVYAPLR